MNLLYAWIIGMVAALAVAQSDGTAASRLPDPALLSHWTFDEPSGTQCGDASGHGCDASLDRPAAGFGRARGVHGQALSLRGAHALRTRVDLPTGEWPAITFSAWVRPTDLSGFRELFRQECPNRLLFSFHEGGTVLSLGLNIGGYVECDAPIQPAAVLDGLWHH